MGWKKKHDELAAISTGRLGVEDMEDDVSTDRDIEAGPGPQIAREMARQWLLRNKINAAVRPTTTAERAEISRLKAEIMRLRDDNETLKAAIILFAGNSTPATTDHDPTRR